MNLSGQIFIGDAKDLITIIDPAFSLNNNEVFVEDINGDATIDLSYRFIDKFHQYINKGNLEFELLNEIDLINSFSNFNLIDLDGDKNKDISYLNSSGEIVWQKSLGNGLFETTATVLLPASNNEVIFKYGDVDKDGDLDIVRLVFDDLKLSWLPNSGNLNFSQEITISTNSEIGDFYSLHLADFDDDGSLDIFASYLSNAFIFFNLGDASFSSPTPIAPNEFLINPSFIPVDLDNDLDLDLIVTDDLSTANGWIEQSGDKIFSNVNYFGEDYLDAKVSIADFDNDGKIDIAISSGFPGDSKTEWYKNDGLGNFNRFKISDTEPSTQILKSGDIDRDGDLDLLIIKEGSLAFFENLISEPAIKGCAYFDENNNGLKDNDEFPIRTIQLDLEPNSIIGFADNDGCFSFFVEDGTYELNYSGASDWQLSSDSSSYSVVVNNDSQPNLDFGFIPRDTFMAGQMHSVSGITRCNRDTKFDFTFQNQGTTVITEGIIWAFPDSLLQIGSQIDPLDTLVNDYQWGWKFTNLYPGETIQRSIELSIPGISDEVEPGTLLEIFSATEATNTQGFVNFFKFNYAQPILCAYDPNDKLISPDREGEENYTLFEDTLIYTVRFQNTGNDTAFTVVVRDTLDESLNVETFNILATSHREILRAEIKEDKYVTFTFEDILLPDSTVNFNGSQGYVSYSIQTKDGLDENTIVENTASIYFDFNPPIVTNTTQNTLVECLPITAADISVTIQEGESYTLPDGMVIDAAGVYTSDILNEEGCPIETIITLVQIVTAVDELAWDNLVSISPNPTQDIFHLDITTNENINHFIQINDIVGNEVYRKDIHSKRNRINVERLSSGTYFLQVREQDDTLIAVKKLIVL